MSHKRHPSNYVDIVSDTLIVGNLYACREGSIKATIKFLVDLSDEDYYIYRILFVDGKYKDREVIIEVTKKPVGSWGMWYITDYIEV